MDNTPRQRARQQTMADIVVIGRKHLATDGAAALSLRAVARDLGVVSSAIYRYVRNRDELLTLLVVDAYTELGDEVEHAVAAEDDTDFSGQFRALGRAVRGWALREPARYALLFGSPVPGYHAPAEQTTTPGTRVITALTTIFVRAYQAGAIRADDGSGQTTAAEGIDGQLARDIQAVREETNLDLPDEMLARGVLVWAALFGAVNFEVFGQYGENTFTAPEQLFEHHLTALAGLIGLR
ncbi:TetR/AcrR family transcriptional regulator [Arthrobacter monumenti]